MRHLKAGNRLGVTTAHRLAMMRNMVTSIIENGQITSTLARAKEVRKPLEKMIGLGKRGTLHSRRQALRFVKSKEAMVQLFGDLADRYKDRNGGYCRIIKLGKTRLGDNSEMAIIQLLGSEGDRLSELKTQKGAKKKQNKKKSTVLKEVSEEIQQLPEKEENVTHESGTGESTDAENKTESGEEELIQKEKQPEAKSDDTAEIKNKVKANDDEIDSTKNAVQEKIQAEASQVKNDADTEQTDPEIPEEISDDTAEIEHNVKVEEDVKIEIQAEASQVKNDADTEQTDPEIPEEISDDTAEIEHNVKVEEDVKIESQAEASQVKNDADTEQTDPEIPEEISTQEKAEADSEPKSNDESEEVDKTTS